MYADDLAVVTPVDKLDEVIHTIQRQATSLNLKINPKKSAIMWINPGLARTNPVDNEVRGIPRSRITNTSESNSTKDFKSNHT
jgi:hypothetical protein